MAEMPPQGAPEQGAAPQQSGGGFENFISKIGQALSLINQTLSSDQAAPPAAKEAFATAADAFMAGVEALAGGGAPQGEAVPMEAGASGAKPVSMGRPG